MAIKTFQKSGGYRVIVGKKYICMLGGKLRIYDRHTHALVCVFSDMRNYSYAVFAEDDFLIAKNTAGVYKGYNCANSACIFTYSNKKIDRAGQDCWFSVDWNNYKLYDVVVYNGLEEHIAEVDLRNGTFQFTDFPRAGHVLYSTYFDDGYWMIQKCLYLTVPGKAPQDVLLVHYKNGQFIQQQIDSKTKNGPVFFTPDFLLYSNMNVLWLKTGKREQLIIPENTGYVTRAGYNEKHQLLFLTSMKCALVYSLKKQSFIFSYRGDYISDATIIDEDLFIGTWEKVLIVKNFVSEYLGE